MGKLWVLRSKEKEKLNTFLREKIAGESKEKAELGCLEIPRNLGSSGYATGPGWD